VQTNATQHFSFLGCIFRPPKWRGKRYERKE
jgi:hypothetical protein